jgi:hypothetical protein
LTEKKVTNDINISVENSRAKVMSIKKHKSIIVRNNEDGQLYEIKVPENTDRKK